MDHYYSKKPSSKSKRKKIKIKVASLDLTLLTDAGVFSKDRIDKGSKLLIETAQKTKFAAGSILDVGCGYGVVGISLAKIYPDRFIEMVDINERAISLSSENILRNEVNNAEAYQSDLYEKVENKKFAGIIANPPIRAGKKVVHQILEEAYTYLKEDGKLQIVIQRKQGAPSAKKKMKEVFGNVERVALEKGYWILESEK